MPRPTILLVESHDDTRELYAEFLSHAQFTVIAEATTDAGLWHAASVDAIVTDISVHGSMNGCELVRRLRENESTARTPIIVLTAYAFQTYRQQAFDAGCDVFLTKPCAPDRLSRELHDLLVYGTMTKPSRASLQQQGM